MSGFVTGDAGKSGQTAPEVARNARRVGPGSTGLPSNDTGIPGVPREQGPYPRYFLILPHISLVSGLPVFCQFISTRRIAMPIANIVLEIALYP